MNKINLFYSLPIELQQKILQHNIKKDVQNIYIEKLNWNKYDYQYYVNYNLIQQDIRKYFHYIFNTNVRETLMNFTTLIDLKSFKQMLCCIKIIKLKRKHNELLFKQLNNTFSVVNNNTRDIDYQNNIEEYLKNIFRGMVYCFSVNIFEEFMEVKLYNRGYSKLITNELTKYKVKGRSKVKYFDDKFWLLLRYYEENNIYDFEDIKYLYKIEYFNYKEYCIEHHMVGY